MSDTGSSLLDPSGAPGKIETTSAASLPTGPVVNGVRKVAILLIALGPEASAGVLKHLSQDEVEQITFEMVRMRDINPATIQSVVEDFHHRFEASEFFERAGIDYAKEVLELTVGVEKAKEILNKLGRRSSTRPFENVRNLDPSQLFQLIQSEHPQTIALILSHLPSLSAAAVLSSLSPDIQSEVASRVATMDATTPEVVQHIEDVLLGRLASVGAQNMTSVGGTSALIEILNQVDRSAERTILEGLESANPTLADAIKEKMFLFEDVLSLDNKTIQSILREVEGDDLRLALKGVEESLREAIFRNISSRAAETLREDLGMMGPVRVKDVEAAQKKIVAVVRRLEEAGEFSTRRNSEDDLIE